MHLVLAALLLGRPSAVFAVGDEDDDPPVSSETTTDCTAGEVWDIATESCLPPGESTDDKQSTRLDIRKLAYAGRLDDAQALLSRLDPADPWVLTGTGFTTRQRGDVEAGMDFYRAALAADPDLHLARSYMGQAMIEASDIVGAWRELREIRARGGSDTWAGRSLAMAIETGLTVGY